MSLHTVRKAPVFLSVVLLDARLADRNIRCILRIWIPSLDVGPRRARTGFRSPSAIGSMCFHTHNPPNRAWRESKSCSWIQPFWGPWSWSWFRHEQQRGSWFPYLLPVVPWMSSEIVDDEVLVWKSSAGYAEFVVASYNILLRMSPLTSTPSSVVSFIVLDLHKSSNTVTNCARARRWKTQSRGWVGKPWFFRSFERNSRLIA